MNYEEFYKELLAAYHKSLADALKIEVKQETKNLWEDYKYQMDLRHDTYIWRTK